MPAHAIACCLFPTAFYDDSNTSHYDHDYDDDCYYYGENDYYYLGMRAIGGYHLVAHNSLRD